MKKKTIRILETSGAILFILILIFFSLLALDLARERARDAKRIDDIKRIRSALALYLYDTDAYPQEEEMLADKLLLDNETIYLQAVPRPPKAAKNCPESSQYTYHLQVLEDDTFSYTIEYCLGQETANIPAGIQTATPAGLYLLSK